MLRAAMLAGGLMAAGAAMPAQVGPFARSGQAEELVVEIPGRVTGLTRMQAAGGEARILVLFEPAPPPAAPAPDAGKSEPARREVCSTGDLKERDPGKPLELAAIRLGGRLTSRVIATGLPAEAGGILAMDVDVDGVQELVLSRPGHLDRLSLDGGAASGDSLASLVEDPELSAGIARQGAREGLEAPGAGPLPVPVLGGVRFYRPGRGGSGSLDDIIDLPLVAVREGQSLRLRSPVPRRIGNGSGERPLYAVGPEPNGHRRLRTILLDPEESGEARRTEWWSRLPGPEKVIASRYTRLEGRPALIVLTRPADKLSFFGEKLLRVFFVDEPDRSRTGAEPVLAVETRINLWQKAEPVVLDVNSDGREDLVVGYWKGIKDDTMMLDAYLRQPDGSFDRSPRTTRFDLEDADRSVLGFGSDLDGDGKADLLLHAGGRGLVYPGIYGASRSGPLVDEAPLWTFSWTADPDDDDDFEIEVGDEEDVDWMVLRPDGYGPCRIVDLEGDGRPEIVLVDPAGEGRDYVRVIRPGRRPPPGPS